MRRLVERSAFEWITTLSVSSFTGSTVGNRNKEVVKMVDTQPVVIYYTVQANFTNS